MKAALLRYVEYICTIVLCCLVFTCFGVTSFVELPWCEKSVSVLTGFLKCDRVEHRQMSNMLVTLACCFMFRSFVASNTLFGF